MYSIANAAYQACLALANKLIKRKIYKNMTENNARCWVGHTESAGYQDIYNYQPGGGWTQTLPIQEGSIDLPGTVQVWVQGSDPVCLAYVATQWAIYHTQQALGMDPDEPDGCPSQHMTEQPAVATVAWSQVPTTLAMLTLTDPAPVPDSYGNLIQQNNTTDYGHDCPQGTSASCTFSECPPPGGFPSSDFTKGDVTTMQVTSSELTSVGAKRMFFGPGLVGGQPAAFTPNDPGALNNQNGYSVNMIFDYTQDESTYTMTATCHEEQGCYCS
jgi:hypothetical protein